MREGGINRSFRDWVARSIIIFFVKNDCCGLVRYSAFLREVGCVLYVFLVILHIMTTVIIIVAYIYK